LECITSSAFFIEDSGFSGDFVFRGIGRKLFPFFSFLCAQSLDILGNWSIMDTRDNYLHQDEEMMENEFVERQHLVIRVISLNSTVLFSLDTSVQRKAMVG
jgi:hypothetical protein